MHFVGPGQYISPPSFELARGQKRLSSIEERLSHVKGVCLMSEVVVLTSEG